MARPSITLCIALCMQLLTGAEHAQAQSDPPGLKRCEVRPGCSSLISESRNCSPETSVVMGGSCTGGLISGVVKRYWTNGNGASVSEYREGRYVPNVGFLVEGNSPPYRMQMHQAVGAIFCQIDGNGNVISGEVTSCNAAIARVGGAPIPGSVSQSAATQKADTAAVLTQSMPQQGVTNARQQSSKSADATVLSPNAAARSSVKIRLPSSLVTPSMQRLEEFVPPRTANACIGEEKAGQFVHVAVTKANSANTMRWDGYFLAMHHFKDPVHSDNETKHDGPFETTSCFKGDRHCTELWLKTLQHCKRWAPAPNRSKSITFAKILGGVDRYPLDCAPESSKRQESMWEKYNNELSAKWESYMEANLPGKDNASDEGATQCAVQLYVPMLQIQLDTQYSNQKGSGIPHSTCDASVFGTK
jgi:hypothetical protein